MGVCMLDRFSCVRFFVTLWTIARQAPLPMEVSRQESWSELPCPPPGDLSNPGIEPASPAVQVDFLQLRPEGGSPKCSINDSYSGSGTMLRAFHALSEFILTATLSGTNTKNREFRMIVHITQLMRSRASTETPVGLTRHPDPTR